MSFRIDSWDIKDDIKDDIKGDIKGDKLGGLSIDRGE